MSEHRGKHIRSSEFARLSMFEEVLAEPMNMHCASCHY
ncbi:predicted protein [Botrytis cinerea T4]|uniref:Uncharacterized protein n=1 Tax=Botryotinia fuckeliana (strain T4) TaxID=999810 RepID=G2YVY7_BOTF4|nr:predicted protein [Botrytis cinerea T4]